ncbi:hypothetical protein [Salmonella phage vB_SalS_TU03]|nr:hypothetical protein [Salmonella phage vB_SalS_TU03]
MIFFYFTKCNNQRSYCRRCNNGPTRQSNISSWVRSKIALAQPNIIGYYYSIETR